MTSLGSRALQHAKNILALNPAGRASATASEQRATEYVQDQLDKLGVGDVRTQKFSGLRSVNLFIALAFGFAVIGHAAYWMLEPPLGGWSWLVSAASFGLCLVSLSRKFTFRDYPLRQYLPHGPSQNLIAHLPAQKESRQKVVFLAHLDSHRAVWWYAHDILVAIYFAVTPIAIGGALIAPLCYGLAILTGRHSLALLALPFALLHFIAWFTGMTADLGLNSPGANDNASAIGTLLGLAERLQTEPLEHTEIFLAFTGCEETGAEGMQVLWQEYQHEWHDALFIDFEMVGIGDQLAYVRSEGILKRRRIPAKVENLVLEAGADFDLKPIGMAGFGALTEIGVVLEDGGSGVCLMTRRSDSPFLPEWHRLTDTADRLELLAMERAHDLGWAILQQIDSQEK